MCDLVDALDIVLLVILMVLHNYGLMLPQLLSGVSAWARYNMKRRGLSPSPWGTIGYIIFIFVNAQIILLWICLFSVILSFSHNKYRKEPPM